jgi:superfamily II DNA or RNA helicase
MRFMLITLLPDNKYLSIDCEEVFFKKIDKLCSYKQDGYMFSPAARSRGWDGTVKLFKKRTAPVGLLNMIVEYCNDHGIDYEIDDKRKISKISNHIDISHRLDEINRTPRWYQIKACEAAVNSPRGIIKAATGSGKTQIAGMIAATIGKPTVILVIGTDLLHSFRRDFELMFQKEIGIVGDGYCEIRDITIVSIWTAGAALKLGKTLFADEVSVGKEKYSEKNTPAILKCLKEAKVVILDECHICACNTLRKIYDFIYPEHFYGMSGSPFADKESDIVTRAIIGDNLVDISASLLIKEGVLAKPFIKFKRVPKMFIDVNSTYAEIYSTYIVNNITRNSMILRDAKMLVSKGYQTLVLFNNIAHGELLKEMFTSDGTLRFAVLDGSDSSDVRNEVREKALAKEIDVIIASKIFNIGVDIPSLSGYINAAAGKAFVSTVQKLGRVIRGYPGKTKAAVIEYMDDAKYLKKHSNKRKDIYSIEPEFVIMD